MVPTIDTSSHCPPQHCVLVFDRQLSQCFHLWYLSLTVTMYSLGPLLGRVLWTWAIGGPGFGIITPLHCRILLILCHPTALAFLDVQQGRFCR